GCHGFRTRAGHGGVYGNRGVIHAGQRGHRQVAERHASEQEDGEAQQHRHDRALDENLREVHSAPVLILVASTGFTDAPGKSRNWPSVTTVSPGCTPLSMTVLAPKVRPALTFRISTELSGFTA